MLYNVKHTTRYDYTEAVSLCHNLVHLRPRIAPRQTCHHSHLLVQPKPCALVHQTDYFGNPVALFTIQEPHRKLSITVKHRIAVRPSDPIAVQESPPWEMVRDGLATEHSPEMLDAFQFTLESTYVPCNADLAGYAQLSFAPGRPLLEAALDLTARIHTEFRYDPKATTLVTPLAEVLQHRRGVCQDFAHLQIGCLRSIGLAARYVSGYLQTAPAPGRERLVGADASHAWISVFCPKFGWIDLDPTNNLVPSEQHLTIAWGRDYNDICPIKGVILGGGTHTLSIAVDVVAV
jgi:transglutaminase-like putative cysteine protease